MNGVVLDINNMDDKKIKTTKYRTYSKVKKIIFL